MMSDARNVPDKLAQPVTTAGMGAVLLSICQLLPDKYVTMAVITSSFLNPFLAMTLIYLHHQARARLAMTCYLAGLKKQIKGNEERIKRGGLEPHIKQHLQSEINKCEVKLSSAHLDYAEGRLKLELMSKLN